MQTETLETNIAEVLPYNDAARLIDREVHAKTLAQINFLAREYEIKNPQAVAYFIGENPDLLELLEEIPAQIRKLFGKEQVLRLEILFEPNFPETKELWVSILTELSAEQSLSLFDKFNEEWWYSNSDAADCKLAVTLEHI